MDDLDKTKDQENQVVISSEETIRKIEDTKNNLIEMITYNCDKMKAEITQEQKKQIRNLKSLEEQVTYHMSSLLSVIDLGEDVVKKGKEVQMLLAKKQLKEMLSSCQNKVYPTCNVTTFIYRHGFLVTI